MRLTQKNCDCNDEYVFWTLGNQEIKTCKSCGRDVVIQEDNEESEPEES